jgi:hypothetical protein
MEGKSIIDLKDKKTTYLASRPSLTLPDTPDGRGTRHTGNPKAEALTSHIQFFTDAYSKGLKGKGAAWAAKKYRGHRVLPETILKEFDDAEKAEKIRGSQGR